jgi:hypothetical protein
MVFRLDPLPIGSRCDQSVVVGLAAAFLLTGDSAIQAQPSTPVTHRPSLVAARAEGTVRVDGVLDEADWTRAARADGFVQVEPVEGQSASERTEVRVLFDDTSLYVGATCHDSSGAADLRVRDLRRDFDETTDDFFGVTIDGVGDGRSALVFRVNPRGALRDQQTVDGGLIDVEFDAIWTARATRNASGWVAEIAIPWRTLRYRQGDNVWGVNFQRVIRRKNETTGWSPWPRATTPFRMDYAGLLSGLEPPPASRNLRLQPYGLAEVLDTDGPTVSRDGRLNGEVGLDLKWAITPNTVLDLTANPDFGQADVDRQVVNLTRFSVFFPERRQFFLENRGLFFTGNGQRFEPFFSRRIGLDAGGNPIPITAGARFSTRSPRGALGALAVSQQGLRDEPASQFGVLRYVANFGAQNRIGGLLTTRADSGDRNNAVGGVDWFYRPTPSSFVRGTLTGSTSSGSGGEGLGGFVWAANEASWGYVGYISEVVTARYEARSGFIVRNDYVRISPAATLDWRPAWRPSGVRRFQPGFTLEHYVSASTREMQEGFLSIRPMNVQFSNGGSVQYTLQPNWQRLSAPFGPLPGIEIGVGEYEYLRHNITVQSDPSARLAARFEAATGGYYDGSLDTIRALVQATPDPRFAVSADYTLNRLVDVGADRRTSTTHLLGLEARVAANPRVQVVSFTQWNTAVRQLSVNARFAWEYRPLAFFNVVYNDRSPVSGLGLASTAPPASRQLLVKFSWLAQL